MRGLPARTVQGRDFQHACRPRRTRPWRTKRGKPLTLIRAFFLLAAIVAFLIPKSEPAMAQPHAGTELIMAAGRGDLIRVQTLLAAKAPVDAQDRSGQTALLLAVNGNHVAIAEALMDAGASINVQAANRDTTWLLAGAQGRAEIIAKMIRRGPDLSIRNRFGGNALIPACERAHVEAIRLLLPTQIDVNHVNNLGWTCLLEIVILGQGGTRHQEAIRLVLQAGADPNLADRDGVTALAHAIAKGQTEVARLIQQAGGRVRR
ncbi:MAG: ankyrin repeat domain-containing protein [Hyphomicrobiales bacterium]|nr:ankyrin repeat domain-containing protein [Hyphomicrobiales bacterium]